MMRSAHAYLAQAKSPQRVLNASSGGVFGLLAKYIFSIGGIVVGAAFDKEMKLKHRVVKNASDLPPLFKSKYVRSDISAVMPEINEALNSGTVVLFVGAPCQVSFVKKSCKGFQNLITCDLLCHGTPTQDYFDSWLKDIEVVCGAKVSEYDFRCKDHGWSPLETSMKLENGKIIYSLMDPYFYAFQNNISISETCIKCPFARPMRQGDFTLGDAWGLTKFWPESNDNRGISLVLSNTDTADAILMNIEDIKLKQIPFKFAIASQDVLSGRRRDLFSVRDVFADVFKETGSLYRAVGATLVKEKMNADKILSRLKRQLILIRIALVFIPIFNKALHRKKKDIKSRISHMQFVLACKWNDSYSSLKVESDRLK